LGAATLTTREPFSDITEYKKLEGEFRITEERLRQQLDRKEQERNSP